MSANSNESVAKLLPLFGYVRLGMPERPVSVVRPLMGTEKAALIEMHKLCTALAEVIKDDHAALPDAVKKYVDVGGVFVALMDLRSQCESIIQLSIASQDKLERLRGGNR